MSGTSPSTTGNQKPAARRADTQDRPYRVVIVAGAKCGVWGRYSDIESAASIAARLQQIGLAAIVEDRDEAKQ